MIQSTFANTNTKAQQTAITSGLMIPFAGTTMPSGKWLDCQGQAISRTVYSSLFNAIGTIWGSGDTVSTFNIPNMRGRIPIGFVPSGVSGISARSVGQTGGSETHTLTQSEIPSHTHSVSTFSGSGSHTHSLTVKRGNQNWDQGGGNALWGADNWYRETEPAGSHTHTATVASTGSANSHDNMQPSSVLRWIIKT